MKVAKLFCVVVSIAGTAHLVSGQERPHQTGHDRIGHDRAKADQRQAKRDQLRIAVQEICPMSGRKLGSMGDPIKVKIGEEMVFLYCKGCLKEKVHPKHWATIHAHIAKAQRICPVMENKIPKKPKWTIVEGRIIYVCCPPCLKKIDADPQTYLKKVDALYATSLKKRKERERRNAGSGTR